MHLAAEEGKMGLSRKKFWQAASFGLLAWLWT